MVRKSLIFPLVALLVILLGGAVALTFYESKDSGGSPDGINGSNPKLSSRGERLPSDRGSAPALRSRTPSQEPERAAQQLAQELLTIGFDEDGLPRGNITQLTEEALDRFAVSDEMIELLNILDQAEYHLAVRSLRESLVGRIKRDEIGVYRDMLLAVSETGGPVFNEWVFHAAVHCPPDQQVDFMEKLSRFPGSCLAELFVHAEENPDPVAGVAEAAALLQFNKKAGNWSQLDEGPYELVIDKLVSRVPATSDFLNLKSLVPESSKRELVVRWLEVDLESAAEDILVAGREVGNGESYALRYAFRSNPEVFLGFLSSIADKPIYDLMVDELGGMLISAAGEEGALNIHSNIKDQAVKERFAAELASFRSSR